MNGKYLLCIQVNRFILHSTTQVPTYIVPSSVADLKVLTKQLVCWDAQKVIFLKIVTSMLQKSLLHKYCLIVRALEQTPRLYESKFYLTSHLSMRYLNTQYLIRGVNGGRSPSFRQLFKPLNLYTCHSLTGINQALNERFWSFKLNKSSWQISNFKQALLGPIITNVVFNQDIFFLYNIKANTKVNHGYSKYISNQLKNISSHLKVDQKT